MIYELKCKDCGTVQRVSPAGWLVETYYKGKKEVRYTEWIHVVGHMRGKKLCPGSGATPRKDK